MLWTIIINDTESGNRPAEPGRGNRRRHARRGRRRQTETVWNTNEVFDSGAEQAFAECGMRRSPRRRFQGKPTSAIPRPGETKPISGGERVEKEREALQACKPGSVSRKLGTVTIYLAPRPAPGPARLHKGGRDSVAAVVKQPTRGRAGRS